MTGQTGCGTGRRTTSRVAWAGLALVGLAAAAACGGGSDDSAAGGASGGGQRSGAPASASAAAGGTSPGPRAGAPAAPGQARTPDPAAPAITLSFAGDVHFEGASASALTGGLAGITPVLSAADLTVVNLETAITERGSPSGGKQFTFRAPPTALPALRRAGVDVVTMANNHALDYGQVGLSDSLDAARAAGLPVVGAGPDADAAFAPHVATVKGRRVAVIGATQVLDDGLAAAWTAGPGKPGLASAKDEPRLVAAVRAARASADVVAVDLHWGTEQVGCPTLAQRGLARALVAAGADIVVGSHAHILLGGGWLDGAYVDYGLGNFVFYARTAPTRQSGVLTLTVQGRAVTAARWTPATIDSGVPQPLSGAAAASASSAWDRLRTCTDLAARP